MVNFGYQYLSSGDYFFPDSETYLSPARQLVKGFGFSDPGGTADTLRTPGYPLLLVPFVALHATAGWIIVFQHLLNVALMVLLWRFGIRRFGDRAACTAALIFAFDVPSIHHANKVLTETSFTALLLILFLAVLHHTAAWRLRASLICGLLCGLMALHRPVALFLFIPLAAYLVAMQVRWKAVALFVIIALLPPVAWATRNLMTAGAFTTSSIGGVNMLLYRAAGALALETAGDFDDNLRRFQKELLDDANGDMEDELHNEDAGELPAAVRGVHYGKIGRRILLEHPRGAALLTIRGLAVNLLDADSDALAMVSRIDELTVQLGLGAIQAVVIFFALLGCMILWRQDRSLSLLVLLIAGYFVFISAGGESEARFRVPVVPILAIAAAIGMERLYERPVGSHDRW